MDPLCLSLSADTVAFPILATVIASVLRHTTGRVEVLIYTRTMRAESFERGRLKVEFRAPRLSLLNRTNRIPGEMFDRLFVMEDKPEWSRALILDWDQLVVGSLDELWSLDLEGTFGAFVRSPKDRTFLGNGWVTRGAWGASMPGAEQLYFRFGGLLDLDACRSEDVMGQMLSWAHTGSTEQALLGAVMAGRYVPMDVKWNVLPSLEQVPADARILHWFGDRKPWNATNVKAAAIWYAGRCSWSELLRQLPI